MDSESAYTELVEYIVKSIVDNPDEVSVAETENPTSIIVEVRVADDDVGRVIGRGGVVVNSIRNLLQVIASKQGKRVSLEIL
ncbi:MAG: KH domain-containing protein [Chloroflexota bacterium]